MDFTASTTDPDEEDVGHILFEGTLQDLNEPKLMLPTSPLGGPSITSPERIRSPSCNKGKTARDFDEELTTLRKENFDLKMRVYVLNEQMELFQNIDNADQLYEVNSNLKKEVEKLRAELSEKDELVLRAGEAMAVLNDKHKEDEAAIMDLHEQYSTLQDMNLRLEQELERLKSQNNLTSSQMGPGMEDSSTQYALAFAPLGFNKNAADIAKLEEELAEKLRVIEDSERIKKEFEEIVKRGKLKEKNLEGKLESMSEKLSELTQELREKENHRLQIVKKACELEEYVSLKQLEVDRLQKMLIAQPTHDDLRDIRNKYECCTTENNVLINRITELENKLDEAESKKFEYEAVQEKVKCSTCRQYKNLAELLESTQSKLSQTERELEQAKKEHFNAVKTLQGCLKANKALTTDIESLNEQIKSCGCSNPKIPQKEVSALKVRDLVERVSQLQQEKQLLTAAMEKNTEALRRQLEEKENIIQDLEQKSADCNNNKIEELEAQVSRLKSEMEGLSSSEAAYDTEKKQLLAEVENKKKEIETLNEELRKRTFNLQELVNKELWDKNREIEKLNKTCERKQQEVLALKERLTAQEFELSALNDKMQELSDQVDTSESISELKVKLTEEIEKRVCLESETEHWMKTAEESEKVRKELTNACGLFKARLEELASFLESLLPCLGSKKRKILQDAIDRSREASRTLSQSVMNENTVNDNTLAIPILPDFSQVDFFSDDDIDVTLASNKSCLSMQNEEVANLRAKMESVVQKLDEVRSSDKSKVSRKNSNYEDRFGFVKLANMSSSFNIEEVSEVSLQESFSDTASAPSRQPSQPKPAAEAPPTEKVYNQASALSESEGWSEPDRNVSLARIGLRDSSVPSGRLSTEESSDNSCKLAICKRRCEAAEIRRLSLKVRSLERVIQNLRTDRASTTRSPSRDVSPIAGGDAPDKGLSAVDDLKKEKTKLEASLKNNKDILNQLTASYEDEPTNKQLLKAVQMIAQQFEQIYGFFTEMEDHYLALEEEKEAVHRDLDEKEKKVDSLNKEVASLQAELKEKENEILEKQCALLEMKNGYILMENKCKMMESTIEELSKWKAAMLKSGEELEALKDSHLKEINNLKNKLKKVKEERDAEVNELKTSLDRAFKRIDDVCLKKVLMETEFKQKVDSLQKEKRSEVEQEVIKRIEVERKLVESYESQGELRKRLDEEMTKSKDVETAQKSSERWWRRRTEEVESTCADREAELRRRLDNASIATSQAVLERTRLANEKIRLQCELRRRENSAHDMRAELEQRVVELEESNKELLRKLKALRGSQHLSDIESPPPFARQRSNPTSDYTSDPDQHELKGSNGNLNHWFPVCGRSNNNCSPDLGIESDQGRLSSLDPPIGSPKTYGDMEREIAYLKRELARKSRHLEEAQRASKFVKKKLEDKIYSELGKTHDLLEKTERNFKKAQI